MRFGMTIFALLTIFAMNLTASRAFAMPCNLVLFPLSSDFSKAIELLETLEISRNPFKFGVIPAQELRTIVARHLPVDVAARVAFVASISKSMVNSLVYSEANSLFALRLLDEMRMRDLVYAKSSDGSFVLVDALTNVGRSVDPSGLSAEKILRINELLKDPVFWKSNLDTSHHAVKEMAQIIADEVSPLPDIRSTHVAKVYGTDFAVDVNFQSPNNLFAYEILIQLSRNELLLASNSAGQPLLIELLLQNLK